MTEDESSDICANESSVAAIRQDSASIGTFRSPAPKFDSPLLRGSAKIAATVESPGSLNRSLTGPGVNNCASARCGSGLSRHSSMRPLVSPYRPPPRVQVTRANQYQSFRVSLFHHLSGIKRCSMWFNSFFSLILFLVFFSCNSKRARWSTFGISPVVYEVILGFVVMELEIP